MSSNNVSLDDLPSPDQLSKENNHLDSLPSPSSLGYSPLPQETPGSDIEDLGRGIAQGATLGSADEITGAFKAAKDANFQDLISGKKDELSRLKKLYRQYQKASEREYKTSKERSPYLYGAGEIGGAIAPAIATGGVEALLAGGAKAGAKALLPSLAEAGAKGAAIGATAGAMGSEGAILGATPEEQQKVASDASTGALAGGVLGAGGSLIGKGIGAAGQKLGKYVDYLKKEKPFIAQMSKAKELGEQGIDIGKRSTLINDLYGRNLKSSQGLLEKISATDEMLGKAVGDSIQNATKNGQRIPISEDILQKAKLLSDYFQKNPAIALDKKSQIVFDNIINNTVNDVSPTEALILRDTMDDVLSKMQGDNSTLANYTKNQVNKFRSGINNILKEQIPEYADAANKFQEFRKLVPETIIGKGVPQDISGVRYGELKKPESKLLGSLQDVVEGSEMPGAATAEAKQTLGALQTNLGSLESKIPEAAEKLGGKENFLNNVRDAANTAAVLKQAVGVNPQEGTHNLLKSVALSGTTGRGKMLSAANLVGLASKKVPGGISRYAFSLPNTALQDIGAQLSSSPNKTISSLAQHLVKGLETKNNANVNAALFALMQNKDARESIANILPDIQPEEQK